MFKQERQSFIFNYITKNNKVTVNELSGMLLISKETIRTDLNEMNESGLIKRCHGGAIANTKQPMFKISPFNQPILKVSASDNNEITKMQSGTVFVIGSFNIDIISRVERFPKPGETLISKSHSITVGGKGANQALASHNAGSITHFVTKVGRDQFSHYAHSHLIASGINYILYESDNHPTGSAIIYVSEQDGENMICISPGANESISNREVFTIEETIKKSDVVLLQLEINNSALDKTIEIAKGYNKVVILNPSPYSHYAEKILDRIDILTPNENEAGKLTGININNIDDAKMSLIALSKKGVKIPIITMGKKGVIYYHENEFHIIHSYPAVTVDTTGAGDAFNGALASQLANKCCLHNAVKFACAYAALSVERQGASNMPTYQQTIQKLEQHQRSLINS